MSSVNFIYDINWPGGSGPRFWPEFRMWMNRKDRDTNGTLQKPMSAAQKKSPSVDL